MFGQQRLIRSRKMQQSFFHACACSAVATSKLIVSYLREQLQELPHTIRPTPLDLMRQLAIAIVVDERIDREFELGKINSRQCRCSVRAQSGLIQNGNKLKGRIRAEARETIIRRRTLEHRKTTAKKQKRTQVLNFDDAHHAMSRRATRRALSSEESGD